MLRTCISIWLLLCFYYYGAVLKSFNALNGWKAVKQWSWYQQVYKHQKSRLPRVPAHHWRGWYCTSSSWGCSDPPYRFQVRSKERIQNCQLEANLFSPCIHSMVYPMEPNPATERMTLLHKVLGCKHWNEPKGWTLTTTKTIFLCCTDFNYLTMVIVLYREKRNQSFKVIKLISGLFKATCVKCRRYIVSNVK